MAKLSINSYLGEDKLIDLINGGGEYESHTFATVIINPGDDLGAVVNAKIQTMATSNIILYVIGECDTWNTPIECVTGMTIDFEKLIIRTQIPFTSTEFRRFHLQAGTSLTITNLDCSFIASTANFSGTMQHGFIETDTSSSSGTSKLELINCDISLNVNSMRIPSFSSDMYVIKRNGYRLSLINTNITISSLMNVKCIICSGLDIISSTIDCTRYFTNDYAIWNSTDNVTIKDSIIEIGTNNTSLNVFNPSNSYNITNTQIYVTIGSSITENTEIFKFNSYANIQNLNVYAKTGKMVIPASAYGLLIDSSFCNGITLDATSINEDDMYLDNNKIIKLATRTIS